MKICRPLCWSQAEGLVAIRIPADMLDGRLFGTLLCEESRPSGTGFKGECSRTFGLGHFYVHGYSRNNSRIYNFRGGRLFDS
jgi:hypothetical protein